MRTYSDIDRPILIVGPTGSGKTTLAREIHMGRKCPQGPFVQVDLAGLRSELIESELFGHVKGAFTGAHTARRGYFQEACGGTLFLDEIGEIDREAQKKLLRVLDEGIFVPVGSCRPLKFDGRVILATHRNLESMVKDGEFRQDLWYRISAFKLELRGLSQDAKRLEEAIAFHWQKACTLFGRSVAGIDPAVMQALMGHTWPGNYRELRHCLERLAYHMGDKGPRPEDLPEWHVGCASPAPLPEEEGLTWNYSADMEAMEKRYLQLLLKKNGGLINETCRRHGVNKSTLIAKMRKYDLTSWKTRERVVQTSHAV